MAEMILTADGEKVPVPEGYTPERVVEILRECGLTACYLDHGDETGEVIEPAKREEAA